MAGNPAPPTAGDPLEPVLHEVEARLKERLRDACESEAHGIENESAAQIRRLEDALLSAAVAAEQTIALRAHIDRRKAEKERSSDEAPRADDAGPTLRLREFRDSSGQLWRAWPVTPGLARQGRHAEQYLGEFHKGWICFESLDSPARRRLPHHPERWAELSDSELIQLLDQAINAPQRKASQGGDPNPRMPS